jgi:aryl-alcohol dehydrogenase-like predicted oxidoreductase
MSISRRKFLEAATLAGLAAPAATAAPTPLPKRVLGPTGARVSILAFGCGSRFLTYTEEKGIEALNRALDLGINYIDTAQSYGNGESERRIGQVLKTRRKEVFLATKVESRNGEEALRSVEASLQRLQTGHVDLLHIHSLADDKDLAAIEAPGGVLKVLYKLRDQKVARAIGITCHSDPNVLKTALERHDFDCTQMALNAALAGGFSWNPAPEVSFQSVALPVANRKKMGVLAMKVFAQGKLAGDAPAEKLLRYSMSLPVAAAVVSMSKLEYIEANVAVARHFKRLPKAEMLELSRDISGKHKLALDRFFRNHVDA